MPGPSGGDLGVGEVAGEVESGGDVVLFEARELGENLCVRGGVGQVAQDQAFGVLSM